MQGFTLKHCLLSEICKTIVYTIQDQPYMFRKTQTSQINISKMLRIWNVKLTRYCIYTADKNIEGNSPVCSKVPFTVPFIRKCIP